MSNVNELVAELRRLQENYKILDKENDSLLEIALAAKDYCAEARNPYPNQHKLFHLTAELSNKVEAREKNHRRKAK